MVTMLDGVQVPVLGNRWTKVRIWIDMLEAGRLEAGWMETRGV